MNKNSEFTGFWHSVLLNSIGIYAVISGNIITLNVFTAITCLLFGLSSLMVMFISPLKDKPEIQEMLSKIAERKKLPLVLRYIDKAFDLLLVFTLFGFAHWWKGIAWFFIHFIFNSVIKNAVENYKKTNEES